VITESFQIAEDNYFPVMNGEALYCGADLVLSELRNQSCIGVALGTRG
jgi:hypothetical protein